MSQILSRRLARSLSRPDVSLALTIRIPRALLSASRPPWLFGTSSAGNARAKPSSWFRAPLGLRDAGLGSDSRRRCTFEMRAHSLFFTEGSCSEDDEDGLQPVEPLGECHGCRGEHSACLLLNRRNPADRKPARVQPVLSGR